MNAQTMPLDELMQFALGRISSMRNEIEEKVAIARTQAKLQAESAEKQTERELVAFNKLETLKREIELLRGRLADM